MGYKKWSQKTYNCVILILVIAMLVTGLVVCFVGMFSWDYLTILIVYLVALSALFILGLYILGAIKAFRAHKKYINPDEAEDKSSDRARYEYPLWLILLFYILYAIFFYSFMSIKW